MVFRQSLYGSSSLQTNPSGSLAFVTVLFLRRIAISCAFIQIYFPDVFFWSKAKICDLCSEVN